MRKKKLLNVSAILLGVLMCFSFSKVQAANSVFSDVNLTRDNLKTVVQANSFDAMGTSRVLGISENRESGNAYGWNRTTTGEGKTVWKIAAYPSMASNTVNYNDLYYCLNASRGFGIQNGDMAEGAKDIYSSIYDMKNTAHKSNISNLAGEDLGKNYNKILWILDHSYIPTGSSEYKDTAEYKNLMRNAKITIQNDERDLTEEQIEVIQQMAIWYFTNSSNENYHLSSENLPSMYMKKAGETEYRQLSGMHYATDEYGTSIDGREIYERMNTLYKYFINNASSSYSSIIPTLSLSNTEAKVEEDGNYFIAGPFELTGENTEAIKSITANVNKPYTLLNSSKKLVDNNDFSKVIGSEFYLRFNKSDITESTQIDLELEYKYDVRTLIFMTDENDPTNTQPVVIVKTEERTENINTNIEIKLTTVKVEKVWNDNENQDGVRPAQIKVALYQGNTKKDEQILQESNSWSYTWRGLLAGNYSVRELDSNGNSISDDGKYNDDYTKVTYQVGVNENNIPLTVITNQHVPEITKVEGTKTWVDENNQDGKRPEKITINLLANGIKIDSKEVTGPKWEYSFENLPKYENGKEIKYTVDEETVEGYQKTINGYDIINEYTPEVIEKTVTKIWNDNNNQDGKRASYGVTLYADGVAYGEEVTLDANITSYTWTNLPKYKEGKEIVYTVKETTVPSEYSASEDGFTITNTYTPGVVEKTVIKKWEDDNDKDKIRPNNIIVTLYKQVNGEKEKVDSQRLNDANNWTYTWTELPKLENGQEITYSIEEISIDGYEVTYSAKDYKDTDKITITNIHTPKEITGKYTVILKKVDNLGKELTGATIKVNGKEYKIGTATLISDEKITSNKDFTLEYTLEEIKAPEGYLGLSVTKDIKIKVEVEELNDTYQIKRAYLVNADGERIETDNEVNVHLEKATNTITIHIVNNPIKKEFDLSLRKFITKVNDNELQRAPIVDTKTIATTGTATYNHTKEPVAVQVGDIVTYTIRVYNEGEVDGYASGITDHLPEWLDFLPEDETNLKYLWTQDINNHRKITTNITSKDSATGEELYSNRENKQLLSAYNGGDSLDYIDVEIKCRVNEKAIVKQLITNIAEISDMQDKEGTEVVTDRDSSKANANLPIDTDLPNYKGNESNKSDLTDRDYYYKGQEDDDDFEKLVVENFDLSLRKFIIAINDTELKSDVAEGNKYTREPVVDTSKMGTLDENGNMVTTAIYNHPKTPVEVKKGDIVTYIIRVYNEGTLSGYANEIIENVPEGLEFVQDSSINMSYGWRIEDGKLVTNYLSDENIENVINAVKENEDGSKTLSYKDVEVQFKVVADPVKFAGETITNWAEINEDSNNDIDSVPGNDIKTEDDIDYEPVKLVYFDLSLRKFITNVNGTEYNNRVPQVDTSKMGTIDEITGEKITTATYTHTKDPVVLETGSIVTYTIRVYNEGTVAGYATEITDNIPEGLEFLPENETNTTYKWVMIDEQGNITQDVSKAVKITSNYLSEENDKTQIINGYQTENGNIMLDYKDVKVAFKVTQPNTSDRIVVNTAQISKDSDDDIDSIPDNNELVEDDIDREYVRVETFDLALQKWVTATKVTVDGKTKTTKTGFKPDSKEMAKVDLVASKLKKTTVKFVYSIRVTNEGQVAGYATEIKDYIPSGLKFVKEDNPEWTLQKDGTVTTDKLKDTLLEPGQSATVEITLTWKNSSTNMGVKTNWAEISADSGDDIDSTPNNNNKQEDDIDDASVILSIKTGSVQMYITLIFISVAILGGGTFAIKKYVMNK